MISLTVRLVVALAIVLDGCGDSQQGPAPMTHATSTEIHSSPDLVGYWQFSTANRPYFGVLHRDAELKRTTLTVGEIAAGQPRIIKKIDNEDSSIRAVDARAMGTDLVFVLEINSMKALQLARASLAALLDPGSRELVFSGMKDLDLSELQAGRVKMQKGTVWNFTEPPRPARWLFSPRFARSTEAVVVIANTADGQAMLFGDAPGIETLALEAAAQPQILMQGSQSIVAARRFAEPYQPFWALRQHSGGDLHRTADLIVTQGDSTRNLSADLGLGPVTAFALVSGADASPWLFALRDRAAASDIVAMARTDRGWSTVGTLPIDARGEELSVERGADGWHLVFAVRTAAAWSLRHQTWAIAR